jgi:hypothetical protein
MPWLAPINPLTAGAALQQENRKRTRIATAVEAATNQSATLSRDPASMPPATLPVYDRRKNDRRRQERRQRQEPVLLDTRSHTDRRSGLDRRGDSEPPPAQTRRFDDYA